MKTKVLRFGALALTVLLAGSLGAVTGATSSAKAASECPTSAGFMGRDVLDVSSFNTQVIPKGQYPDYSQYASAVYSYEPCQWADDKYAPLRDDLRTSYIHAQSYILAGDYSQNATVKAHYQLMAKREIFPVLASAMADWAAETEPTAANSLLAEFWTKDLTNQDVAKVYNQLRWHYTYIGELEGRVSEIYDTIDFMTSTEGKTGQVIGLTKAYNLGYDEFKRYTLAEAAGEIGLANMAWIGSYTKILAESQKIVIPTFYKTQRSIIQNSWTALIGGL